MIKRNIDSKSKLKGLLIHISFSLHFLIFLLFSPLHFSSLPVSSLLIFFLNLFFLPFSSLLFSSFPFSSLPFTTLHFSSHLSRFQGISSQIEEWSYHTVEILNRWRRRCGRKRIWQRMRRKDVSFLENRWPLYQDNTLRMLEIL